MGVPSNTGDSFEPSVAGFFCHKCGKKCLAQSGEPGHELPANLTSVRIICAEQVSPELIRQAFHYGADGVLICGCLVGQCDSLDGDSEVLAHIHRTQLVLKEMGLAQGRLRQQWVCSPEMENMPQIVAEFTEQLRPLGPLKAPAPETI